ncbi:MAG: EAL domain-containing protein [Synergistaceae bacterium]|nr:EAL domain-containing protein [Synergistaceae bacterium]
MLSDENIGFCLEHFPFFANIYRRPLTVSFGLALVFAVILLALYSRSRDYRRKMLEEAERARLSDTDEATGLYNKRAFLRKVEECVAGNPPNSYVLMRWDIDRFRVYNDVFGVEAGDRLLREIGAYTLKFATQGPGQAFAHLEADHFACCVPRGLFDDTKAVGIITDMLDSLSPDYRCTPRIGAYLVEDKSLAPALICDRAMLALRSTKGDMTRQFAWYDDSMREASIRDQNMLSDISAALKNDEFGIYMQPQYDQFTDTIVGAEALARWFHPQKGMLSPGVFIDIMERNGLISKLSEAVWEKTARWIGERQKAGLPLVHISVNVSRRDFYDKALMERLCALPGKYGFKPELMHLEITETSYMEDPKQLIDVVEQLRANGFTVEMDDFGSGYSSLSTLKEVPVDILKLDMKFLSIEGDSSDNSGVILSSVIRMAHWMNLPVIAEGVETVQQADYLKSVGCRYVQGFFFARPMPAAEFERLLDSGELSAGRGQKTDLVESYFNSEDFWQPESRASAIFNTLVGAAGIFEYDGERLTGVRVNDKYIECSGANRERLLSATGNLIDTVHPDDAPRLRECLRRAAACGEEQECEFRSLTTGQGGGPFWFRSIMRRVAYTAERTILYGSLENITERKEMEDRLRLENQFNHSLMSLSGVSLFELDLQKDTYTYYRPSPDGRTEEIRVENYSSSKELHSYMHPDDRAKVYGVFRGEGGAPRGGSFEFRATGFDCEDYRWLRVYFTTTADENGKLLRVMGQVADIQEQKEKEARLAALTERFGEMTVYDPEVTGRIFRYLYGYTDAREAVMNILRTLGEYFDMDRVYIVENSEDNRRGSNTYEWCADGVAPQMEFLQDYDYGAIGGWEEYVSRLEPRGFFIVKDVSLLEDGLRELLEKQNIRSMLHCAFYDGDEIRGYVGFDDCRSAGREWPEELLGTLSTACRIIGLFLIRERARQLSRFSDDFLEAIDRNSSYIYITDPANFEIGYLNQNLAAFYEGQPSPVGHKCYKHFLNREAPCEDCPVTLYMRDGCAQPLEIQRPTGMWLLCSASPIFWQGRDQMMVTCVDISAQKEKAEKLRISEDILRAGMEQMGKIICRYDAVSRTFTMPRRYAEIRGLPEVMENYPDSALELLHMDPSDKNVTDYIAFYEAILRGEKNGTVETRFAGSAGNLLWYRAEFVNIFDDGGRPVYAVVALEDTTAQHDERLAGEIYRSQLLTAVQSAWPLAIAVNLTRNSFVTICLEKDYPIQRLPHDGSYTELVAVAKRVLHPDDWEKFRSVYAHSALLAASEDKKGFRVESRQICDDGETHWIENVVRFIDDPSGGGELFCLILCRPIDEQKAMEEQLRDSLARTGSELERERFSLQTIDRNMKALLLIYSPEELSVRWFGGRLLESYGYSAEEIAGFAEGLFAGIMPEEDWIKSNRHAAEMTARREPEFDQEYRIRRKDGTYAWVLARSRLTTDVEGEPVYIGVVFDISSRRETEEMLHESNSFIRLAARLYNRILYRYDVRSRDLTAINPEVCREVGFLPVYPDMPETAIAKGLVMPESEAETRRLFDAMQSGKPSGSARLRLRLENGSEPLWFELRFRSQPDSDGRPFVVALSMMNVNDIYEKELTYARYLVSAHDESNNGVAHFEMDLTSGIVERQSAAAPQLIDLTGMSYDDAAEYMIKRYFHEDAREAAREDMRLASLRKAAEEGKASLSYNHAVVFSDGGEHWINTTVQFVSDPYNDHVKAFITFSDVTDERNRDLTYRRLAEMDPLTGLYNRNALEQRVNALLKEGRKCALLMIDMDNLKTVNDSAGHAEGDRALRCIAETMRGHFREGDVLARIGGDEFTVMMADVSAGTSLHNVLRSLLRKISSVTLNGGLRLGCSVGVAFRESDTEDFNSLYHRADKALYFVKRNGKGSFAFYLPDMEKEDYSATAENLPTLNAVGWIEGSDVSRLLEVVSVIFPLVVSANLTRNSFHMLEYQSYTTKAAPEYGVYSELINIATATFHPEDRESFATMLKRENLLAAFERGERGVTHQGRQMGDDGIYRLMRTDLFFFKNDDGDVCEISLSREVDSSGGEPE